jgi:methylphosphotriester-DNA--protein-cysteine methyltransferase
MSRQAAPAPAATDTGASFIGNRHSHIFHFMTCTRLPAEQNRITFATRQEAIDAGFRACRYCNP